MLRYYVSVASHRFIRIFIAFDIIRAMYVELKWFSLANKKMREKWIKSILLCCAWGIEDVVHIAISYFNILTIIVTIKWNILDNFTVMCSKWSIFISLFRHTHTNSYITRTSKWHTMIIILFYFRHLLHCNNWRY